MVRSSCYISFQIFILLKDAIWPSCIMDSVNKYIPIAFVVVAVKVVYEEMEFTKKRKREKLPLLWKTRSLYQILSFSDQQRIN